MNEIYPQSYIYEEKEDSVEILRCFSYASKIEIPENIEGKPVKAVGDYAFSAHRDEEELREGLRLGKYKRTGSGLFADQESVEAVCGERLEGVTLPEGLRRVGAYCFYNCRNLGEICFTSGTQEWGRGAFTGCHHVRRLRYRELPGTFPCLREVLLEIGEALMVEYCGEGYARLMFPEYYEEGVENTPARILMTRMHGSGMYYRNCFRDRRFQFEEYDRRFDQARPLEDEAFLLELAINRLRWPWKLTEKNRERYEEWLSQKLAKAGARQIEEKNLEGLRWVLGFAKGFPQELGEALPGWIQEAAVRGFQEGLSYLMEEKRRQGTGKKGFREFEL